MRPADRSGQVRAQWVRETGRVVAHEGDGEICKLTVCAPEIARRAVPGQFVQVHPVPARLPGRAPGAPRPGGPGPASAGTGGALLLRRPFSFCEIRPGPGEIALIYRVVGRGTRALSQAPVGVELDLLGPLGRSFPDPRAGRGRLVLIGGGLGIPPMAAAARWAVQAGRDAVAILGARTARDLAGAREVAACGIPVVTVTEDGSAGQQGIVTEPLERMLRHGAANLVGEVWACGPEPMLVAVKRLCAAARVPCFVSVERFMGCGFGACLGCTVPRAAGGYLKACQDGPVFPAEEVVLGDV
ncbi:dihydroorotate dehydrogenase electron transfer subunit [Symbiobacterium thermophilum]|uniref:Dihydroorotate dehydrogenase electron transfer subunit n=1 Tax=Symbiobacterium thermophilum TaxID=2734 RepID=A0A953LE90_SYMTR|nr:dihydroorotate dehydrogenase electron transfer subunit [Symbiobacterium thermophilum]MBY6276260.1 dihydroorotate dehydrogenase electron transfer subunit [Symbiobacterium thermophilum]